MKTAIALTIGAMVATTFCQSLSGSDSLASCGQNCVNSMVGKAGELGCSASDYACLCLNSNFSYGIRDCSTQSCGSQTDADAAQSWARDFCSGYGVAVTSSGAKIVPSSTGSATSTESSGGSATTTTATESGSTSTTTTATGTEITAPGVTSSFTTIISSGSITLTSTGVLTAPGLTTTVAPSQSGDNGDNNGNGDDNSAHATAVPLGVLAAAGLAVFLL